MVYLKIKLFKIKNKTKNSPFTGKQRKTANNSIDVKRKKYGKVKTVQIVGPNVKH